MTYLGPIFIIIAATLGFILGFIAGGSYTELEKFDNDIKNKKK
tara:strand:+ start:681 stop:809 length:129 start_codon:yes stop_codon:yes gene_type:complete